MLPFGETVMWRDPEGSNWTSTSSWRFGNLAWSRRQVGLACDRREAGYIPCQDNPKVATAGKTRDTHVAGTARYTVVNANRQV